MFQSAVTGGLDSKEKDLSVCSSTDSFIRIWFILYWRVGEASETLSRVTIEISRHVPIIDYDAIHIAIHSEHKITVFRGGSRKISE